MALPPLPPLDLDLSSRAFSESGDINAYMNSPFTVGGAVRNKFNANTAVIAAASLLGVFLWLRFGKK